MPQPDPHEARVEPGSPAHPLAGFTCAGQVGHRGLNLSPADPPAGRHRHKYGDGPFARLVMPPLPAQSGIYAWVRDGVVLYLGQTQTPLSKRLGSNGYSTISTYNTLARQPGRTNGGQQTNCRINALANAALTSEVSLFIWYRIAAPAATKFEEAEWMSQWGMPPWNRRLELTDGRAPQGPDTFRAPVISSNAGDAAQG